MSEDASARERPHRHVMAHRWYTAQQEDEVSSSTIILSQTLSSFVVYVDRVPHGGHGPRRPRGPRRHPARRGGAPRARRPPRPAPACGDRTRPNKGKGRRGSLRTVVQP